MTKSFTRKKGLKHSDNVKVCTKTLLPGEGGAEASKLYKHVCSVENSDLVVEKSVDNVDNS